MHFKQYFFPIFAYLIFLNLVLPENGKANLKESFKQRSDCSYENAQFEKKDYFENSIVETEVRTRRYCITGDKRVVSYFKSGQKKPTSGYVNRGFIGKEESYFSTLGNHSSWIIDQWEIEDDQLISYTCYSSSAYKCTGNINRKVIGFRIGSFSWERHLYLEQWR